MKEQSKELNLLALSLPEKYVSKSDFDNLVKVVHHRFDRLEEKISKVEIEPFVPVRIYFEDLINLASQSNPSS